MSALCFEEEKERERRERIYQVPRLSSKLSLPCSSWCQVWPTEVQNELACHDYLSESLAFSFAHGVRVQCLSREEEALRWA